MLSSLRVGSADVLLAPAGAWQPYPRWGSFVMAPWVGPISQGRLAFRGAKYEVTPNEGEHAVHGVVAGVPWEVEEIEDDSASMVRDLDGLWPFGGQVRQVVRLSRGEIIFAIEVRAATSAMPVSAGWHPWFRRGSGEVVVRVGGEHHLVHDGGLPTGGIEPVGGEVDLRDGPVLGDRRIDAVYLDSSGPTLLETSEYGLIIEADPETNVTVVYTPPAAVCVERWSAWPDAHRFHEAGQPAGLAVLEPGETFRRWTRWSWETEVR